jgi:Lrp/AsnC family transcriptional regulator, regulator for asnA, asnC and gidA
MAKKYPSPSSGLTSAVDQLDELDLRLIDLLQIDGRQPNTELARKLKVAEGTVRNRIARLLDENLIQVGAWVDPVRVGGQIYAHIEVEVENSRIDAVAQQISLFSEVNFEFIQTGRADLFLGCFFRSTQHMDEFVTRKLAGVKGILGTSSVIVLRIVKRHYRFPTLEQEPPRRKATKRSSGRSARRHAEGKG